MNSSPTMTAEKCSPWPPALLFTPEVPDHRSAATMAFGKGWDEDPAEMDLDLVADQIMLKDSAFASFVLQLEV